MREMITYRGERANFNFRVAAIAFDPGGERVLIHRGVTDPFWILPGGRVELREPAAVALKRELQEELKIDARIERLLWVVENFFEYNGRQCHEIAFYFLVTFPLGAPIYAQQQPFSGYEEGVDLIFQWQTIDTLGEMNLLPAFLSSRLRSLPETTEHIVHIDE